MASIRDHFGSTCPCCTRDILQAPPTSNRMPSAADTAWCPSCHATLTAEDLARRARRGGFLRRLLGGGPART